MLPSKILPLRLSFLDDIENPTSPILATEAEEKENGEESAYDRVKPRPTLRNRLRSPLARCPRPESVLSS